MCELPKPYGPPPQCVSSTARKTSFRAGALLVLLAASLCLPVLSAQVATPVPVLTWRYDLTQAGQNTSETALSPSNVTPDSFGKLFSGWTAPYIHSLSMCLD